jgi:tripartite-type tricarboxylate transporter receptor subunit TctC
MRYQWLRFAAISACFVCAMLSPIRAAAEEPFYKGKRVTYLINYAASGPTDVEGRLLARYLARHIEGSPSIVIQNKDGAAGLVGTTYLGEVGPRDGTMIGFLTGAAWKYLTDPQVHRVDVRTYEFIGFSPGNAVYYVRSDLPPGIRQASDVLKTHNLVAAGLAAGSSKDFLIRATLDMLGVPYRYITGYRSSATARLAVQKNEASLHSESAPAYFSQIEPTLVRSGELLPLFYDPNYDGSELTSPDVLKRTSMMSFPDFYKSMKGQLPSGNLWEAYLSNLAVAQGLLRTVVMPPGSPPAAVAAMRKAIAELNHDEEFQKESVRVMQFTSIYETGPDLNERVRKMMHASPEVLDFVRTYMKTTN